MNLRSGLSQCLSVMKQFLTLNGTHQAQLYSRTLENLDQQKGN